MSGSLWLVPREGHPFTKAVQELISSTIPTNFSASIKHENFFPHVTVTSGIDLDKIKSPQEWLDKLKFPDFKKEYNEVHIELDHVEAGDTLRRKMVIEVNPDDNLKKLAAVCRQETGANQEEAQKWASTEFAPHMSLSYADIPKADVKNKIPLIDIQIGFALGELFACCGGTLLMGGQLVLVPTYKPTSEWKPLASRETPWAMWEMSRNLA